MTDPILIIGGGLSGLLLAQGLRKNNLPFRLFERDPSLHARTQGFRVRVSDRGVWALQQNLSEEHFLRFRTESCSDTQGSNSNVPSAILDTATGDRKGSDALFKAGQKPSVGGEELVLSVDRGAARQVLIQGIEASIEYGKEMMELTEDESGVQVSFSDGTTTRGCLLIGADGAWSRVRKQLLPNYELADSGARLIFGKTGLSEKFLESFSAAARDGLKLLHSEQRKCLIETMRFNHTESKASPDDYIYWVLFLQKDHPVPDSRVFNLSKPETLQLAQELVHDWHQSLKPLFDPAFVEAAAPYRIVTTTPATLQLSAGPLTRTVLLGDAAHPMPPTAALGATTALTDAGELVQQLVQEQEQQQEQQQQQQQDQHDVPDSAWLRACRKFETSRAAYATAALQKSLFGGRAVFGMKDFHQLDRIET